MVLVEVDEDTTAYDKGHIKGAIKLDWTTDLQDQVRRDFVSKAQFEALLSDRGVAGDDTRRPVRRQQQLVRRLRLLVLQALRPRGRQAARRRSKEVGARLARAGRRAAEPRGDVVHRQGAGPLHPCLPRRDRRGHRRQNLVDVRSPRRVRRSPARPGAPPAGAGTARGPHPDRSQRPVEQGGQRRRHLPLGRRAEGDLQRGRCRLVEGHDRLLPDRRALQPHLVRAQGDPRAGERQELRRLLDRVRLAGRRPDRARRRAGEA